MARSRVSYEKDLRDRDKKQQCGLFTLDISGPCSSGTRVTLQGPMSPEIQELLHKTYTKVCELRSTIG